MPSLTRAPLVLLLALLCASAAAQEGARTPPRDDPERKAVADALRAPVEKQLKQKVVFKIDSLKVKNDWAFLRGVPRRADGGALDYKGTVYEAAVEAGAFDDGVVALLRKRRGRWQVVQYVVGATDVPYVDWDRKYRAPSEIFQ